MDQATSVQFPPHAALMQRLLNHPFEASEGPLEGFCLRLQKERGWPKAFALRAIEEYRRFCFLACVSETPMTPSEEVDCVWHLHLLYTRDYWETFCPTVLDKALHHGPTRGGHAEEARFYDQYAQTLALYQVYFGAPDPNFWPAARFRFEPATHWRWVYLPDTFLVPSWSRLWKTCCRYLSFPFTEKL